MSSLSQPSADLLGLILQNYEGSNLSTSAPPPSAPPGAPQSDPNPNPHGSCSSTTTTTTLPPNFAASPNQEPTPSPCPGPRFTPASSPEPPSAGSSPWAPSWSSTSSTPSPPSRSTSQRSPTCLASLTSLHRPSFVIRKNANVITSLCRISGFKTEIYTHFAEGVHSLLQQEQQRFSFRCAEMSRGARVFDMQKNRLKLFGTLLLYSDFVPEDVADCTYADV